MNEAHQLTSLCLDQRQRWRRGERVLVEAYLADQPAAPADPDVILDLIYNEIVLREAGGEDPQLDEYLARFPHLATELRRQFEIHGAIQENEPLPINEDEIDGEFLGGDFEPAGAQPSVPGYRILRELGRGGMGVVYEAHQISLKRAVALKMILAGAYASRNELARFRTEAEAVARLQHPNIVQIHEIGEHQGLPYFSLELIEGESLEKKIAGRPQPPREAAQLVEILAHAVHHAHQHDVIHRDLKPANVLLQNKSEIPNREGKFESRNPKSEKESSHSFSDFGFRISDFTPKVTDFGLAKLLDLESGATPTQALIGTPNYMAPEQAEGRPRQIGPAADIYGLGAILYELLTGKPPFHGDTAIDTIWLVRSQPPAPPSRAGASVSSDLETITLKCLDKEPGRRYATAADLADDLRRFLDGKPILARPARPWQRAWMWAKRRPAAAALIAFCSCALLCATIFFPIYREKAHQAALRLAEENGREFEHQANEALFHAMISPIQGDLFSGEDLASNAKTTETAARRALSLASNFRSPPDEIQTTRYTLLLVLAEAVSQLPVPDGSSANPYQEALHILDTAPQLGLDTIAYHLRRSRFLNRLGQREAAEREEEQAKRLPLQTALDHFLVGEERFREGDLKAATAAFDDALFREPNHFWSQFYLAVCYLRAGHFETAKAHLSACLVQQPQFVWIYILRSFANGRSGAFESANADIQKALQLDPNDDARYALVVHQGNLHFDQKLFGAAAADFQAAITLEPKKPTAHLGLGQVYLSQARFAEAAAQMTQAMALHPAPLALFGFQVDRARAFYKAKKFEDVLGACDEALRISPDAPLPYELRGRALSELQRYTEALRAFDQCNEKGGAGADLFRERGHVFMTLGRYSEAVDDFTRAISADPNSDTYAHRAWAHFLLDDWKPALQDFDSAIKRDPSNRDAYIGRGLAHVTLGQYRAGVADAKFALRKAPDTPEMMHNIACIFSQAAGKVGADKAEKNGRTLAAAYVIQALAALRQTVALVPPDKRRDFWRHRVGPDSWLDPIRKSVEFQQLERDVFGRMEPP
jgi:serine/threonine protein kinase/tetratricopeptide (TPR) repeat protein